MHIVWRPTDSRVNFRGGRRRGTKAQPDTRLYCQQSTRSMRRSQTLTTMVHGQANLGTSRAEMAKMLTYPCVLLAHHHNCRCSGLAPRDDAQVWRKKSREEQSSCGTPNRALWAPQRSWAMPNWSQTSHTMAHTALRTHTACTQLEQPARPAQAHAI